MRVDEMGQKMGKDEMGSRRSGNKPDQLTKNPDSPLNI